MKKGILENAHFSTLCVHGSGGPDPATGAVAVPIYQTSTFAFPDTETAEACFAGDRKGYIYTRLQNPTTEAFECEMAFLERGEAAAAFASGMAAIAMGILTFVRPGEKIIAARTVYGGTHALFEGQLARLGVEVVAVDGRDPANFEAAIDEATKLVFVETPANPTLCIVDIAEVAEIARAHGVPLMVDNTFATPYLQRPLELGAHLVVHSATKYIGGHGDALGGVLVGSDEFIRDVRQGGLKEMGAVMSPFTAWLLLRGLKTLPVRMERHGQNALQIARFLERHPKVRMVSYPGLESHPQYQVARRQMNGSSGVVSLVVEGGRDAAGGLLNAVELISIAVSLGDCDTLIEHPASMTHRSYDRAELEVLGISEGLVRLSVGLEHPEDLISDLRQAFDRI